MGNGRGGKSGDGSRTSRDTTENTSSTIERQSRRQPLRKSKTRCWVSHTLPESMRRGVDRESLSFRVLRVPYTNHLGPRTRARHDRSKPETDLVFVLERTRHNARNVPSLRVSCVLGESDRTPTDEKSENRRRWETTMVVTTVGTRPSWKRSPSFPTKRL